MMSYKDRHRKNGIDEAGLLSVYNDNALDFDGKYQMILVLCSIWSLTIKKLNMIFCSELPVIFTLLSASPHIPGNQQIPEDYKTRNIL